MTRSRRLGALAPALISLGLVGLVAAVFWRASGFGYLNFDDPVYVVENPWVPKGLTRPGIVWSFTNMWASNWHPLTWLSHMADVELFGLGPAAPHAVNIALHAINSLLVFHLLRTATGAAWRSATVAALFAVHPLHVESVAWISERKDVLSTLFLLLALRTWVGFARAPTRLRYAATLGFFALGLLAKPMVVTLPFLLLLLDAWPLGRMTLAPFKGFLRSLGRLAVEKLPFFALSAAACVVTWVAQSSGGEIAATSPVGAWPRIANAVVSYARYPLMTIWPAGLASFYPHPGTIRPDVPLAPLVAAAAAVAVMTVWALRCRLRRPWLAWGWFWYLGTLLPVSGLVQVGGQAMADRYTYVPLIGLFVAAVWGAADVVERWSVPRWVPAAMAGTALTALAVVAWIQVGFWRDSEILHRRSLAVTDRNWKAWQGLCGVLLEEGRLPEAAAACEAAIRILPTFPEAWQTLGVVRVRMGQPEAAIPLMRHALELRPNYFVALHNLGSTFGNLGDYDQAVTYFRLALRIRPNDAETWSYLVRALVRAGDHQGALEALERLRALDPSKAAGLEQRLAPDVRGQTP
ncbi:MAG TPA: tetratricopeptide repeat protein [Anaeromyxobacteraceae bacterium]|nr:tetratricopeptide repeat protein [Anaeromyxobacteraceae bacterium]